MDSKGASDPSGHHEDDVPPEDGRRRVPEPVREALTSSDIPKIYANGFSIGITNADTYVVLQLNERPIAVVHLSYTLAKTLQHKVGRLVAEFEAKADQNILTTDKINAIFAGGKEAE